MKTFKSSAFKKSQNGKGMCYEQVLTSSNVGFSVMVLLICSINIGGIHGSAPRPGKKICSDKRAKNDQNGGEVLIEEERWQLRDIKGFKSIIIGRGGGMCKLIKEIANSSWLISTIIFTHPLYSNLCLLIFISQNQLTDKSQWE